MEEILAGFGWLEVAPGIWLNPSTPRTDAELLAVGELAGLPRGMVAEEILAAR